MFLPTEAPDEDALVVPEQQQHTNTHKQQDTDDQQEALATPPDSPALLVPRMGSAGMEIQQASLQPGAWRRRQRRIPREFDIQALLMFIHLGGAVGREFCFCLTNCNRRQNKAKIMHKNVHINIHTQKQLYLSRKFL